MIFDNATDECRILPKSKFFFSLCLNLYCKNAKKNLKLEMQKVDNNNIDYNNNQLKGLAWKKNLKTIFKIINISRDI